MSSDLRVDSIANNAGKSPDIAGGELCRTRFNLNGSGVIAASDSFGVSSFTDNGVGDFTCTFLTAMPNAGYSFTGSCNGLSGSYFNGFVGAQSPTAATTAGIRFAVVVLSGTPAISTVDAAAISGVAFGDKA